MTASNDRDVAIEPSEVERWLLSHLEVERVDSARGLYELMPKQRGGQLPLVDVPYDPFSESHWAEAARIADYVAHAPEGHGVCSTLGRGTGGRRCPWRRLVLTSK